MFRWIIGYRRLLGFALGSLALILLIMAWVVARVMYNILVLIASMPA